MRRSVFRSAYPFQVLSPENSQRKFQLLLPLWIKQLQQWLIKTVVAVDPQVQVWYHCDRSGTIWWNGYDPSTGRSIHKVSEAEIRCWLERR